MKKTISRMLNHMTLASLNNYAINSNAIIEINNGSAEEVLFEIEK